MKDLEFNIESKDYKTNHLTKEELEGYKKRVREYNRLLSPWNKIYTAGMLIGGAVLGTALAVSLLYQFSQYLQK